MRVFTLLLLFLTRVAGPCPHRGGGPGSAFVCTPARCPETSCVAVAVSAIAALAMLGICPLLSNPLDPAPPAGTGARYNLRIRRRLRVNRLEELQRGR